MSEFGRSGPPLPHDQAAMEEHFKEVGEDIQNEKAANEAAKGSSAEPRRRPWWRFWGKRSS